MYLEGNATMFGLDPNNETDLLIEYLIKSNEIGVKRLLISYGIMADTQRKQIAGLMDLLASGDEDTIFKIIALDPNASLHKAYFDSLNENVKIETATNTNHIKPIHSFPYHLLNTHQKNTGIDLSLSQLLIGLIIILVFIKILKHYE